MNGLGEQIKTKMEGHKLIASHNAIITLFFPVSGPDASDILVVEPGEEEVSETMIAHKVDQATPRLICTSI